MWSTSQYLVWLLPSSGHTVKSPNLRSKSWQTSLDKQGRQKESVFLLVFSVRDLHRQRPHAPGSNWVGNEPQGWAFRSQGNTRTPLQQSFVNCHRMICNISDNSSRHSPAYMYNCLLELSALNSSITLCSMANLPGKATVRQHQGLSSVKKFIMSHHSLDFALRHRGTTARHARITTVFPMCLFSSISCPFLGQNRFIK